MGIEDSGSRCSYLCVRVSLLFGRRGVRLRSFWCWLFFWVVDGEKNMLFVFWCFDDQVNSVKME
jgi:hypothetical protein